MTRKLLAVCMVVMVVLSSVSFSVSAQQSTTSVITEEFWRAANIQVKNDAVVLSRTSLAEDDGDQVASPLTRIGENGTKTYVEETVFAVPKEGYTTEDVYAELSERYDSGGTRSSNSITITGKDSSISVEGMVKIYYDSRVDSDGLTYVKLTQVNGGYTILDRQVKVVSQMLAYGCTGWSKESGYVTQEANLLEYGTATSWSAVPPSNWEYVNLGPIMSSAGANCYFTLQRMGSEHTWTLHVVNNI